MEIYETLKEDHIKIKGLLEELMDLNKDDDYHMIIVQQIADDLLPHTRAEEAVLYNAMRAMTDDHTKIRHAFKDHMEAETLLRMLQVKDVMDFDWKETAKKLRKALEHHITEEENETFADARRLFTTQEAIQMNEAFEKMKQEIEGHGFMKNTFDTIKNLMPPKFLDKMKNLGQDE